MVTPVYAALLGLMLVGLSVHVIRGRTQFGIGLGDEQNLEMQRRISAQANFAQYAPMFVLLLACSEYGGLVPWGVHAVGLLFLAGRVMHAYSVLVGERYDQHKLTVKPMWRIRGMVCTFVSIVWLSVIVLIQWMFV